MMASNEHMTASILKQLDSVCMSLPNLPEFSPQESDISVARLVSKIKPIFIQAFRSVEPDQRDPLKKTLECILSFSRQANKDTDERSDAGYSVNHYFVCNPGSRDIFLNAISYAFDDRKSLDTLFTFNSLKTLYNDPKQYFNTYDALLSLRFLDVPFEISHGVNQPIFDQQNHYHPVIQSLVDLTSFMTNIAVMVTTVPTTLVLKVYVHLLSYLTRLQSALLNWLTANHYDELILDKLGNDNYEHLIEKNRQFNGVFNALLPLFTKQLPKHIVGLIASIAYRTIILLPVAMTFLVSAVIRDILEAMPIVFLLAEIPILIIAKTAITLALNLPLYIGSLMSGNQAVVVPIADAPDDLVTQEIQDEIPELIPLDDDEIVCDEDEEPPLISTENSEEALQEQDVDANQDKPAVMSSWIGNGYSIFSSVASAVPSWFKATSLNDRATDTDSDEEEFDVYNFLV